MYLFTNLRALVVALVVSQLVPCCMLAYAATIDEFKVQASVSSPDTVGLAKKVSSCYNQLGIPRSSEGGGRNVAGTVATVSRGLADLIDQCRKKKVCPAGSK